jgi:transcriptional regulator with XRE-family HTH domain
MTEEEFVLSVCNKIKDVRIQKGITQFDLATDIGIDDSSLRRVENGRTSPTLKTLFKIASALHIKVGDLLP